MGDGDGDSLDELTAEIDALLEDLGIEPPPPLVPISSVIEPHLEGLGRHYAEYRSTLPAQEALMAACRSEFNADEYARFTEYLDAIRNTYRGPELLETELTGFINICEQARELLCTIQPRELARRSSLSIDDLAEAWASDVSAWMCPANQPDDYWIDFAVSAITENTSLAGTRTGRRIKLDKAVLVAKKVQAKHLQAGDVPACDACEDLIERLQAVKR